MDIVKKMNNKFINVNISDHLKNKKTVKMKRNWEEKSEKKKVLIHQKFFQFLWDIKNFYDDLHCK